MAPVEANLQTLDFPRTRSRWNSEYDLEQKRTKSGFEGNELGLILNLSNREFFPVKNSKSRENILNVKIVVKNCSWY